MNPSNKQITVFTVLVAAGIFAGAVVRFLHLGWFALDNQEATLALQSYEIINPSASGSFSGHPLYLLLTSMVFFFAGGSNFLARFWPCVAGILLLVAPLFFQKYLGKSVTVILTWILAIEPSMVAASRTAGSDMLSLTLIVLVFSAIMHQKYKTSAVLLGFALLSGPTFWIGLIQISMAYGLWFLWTKPKSGTIRLNGMLRQPFFWLLSGSVVLLFSTIFLLLPNGISAFSGSMVDFLSLVTKTGNTSLKLVLLSLPFYSPLVLFAGLIGMAVAVKSRVISDLYFTVLALLAFVVILLMPGRQMLLMIWVTLPLSILASRQIGQVFTRIGSVSNYIWLIAAFVIIILLFIWQVLGTFNQGSLDMVKFLAYIGAGIGILLLCAILAIFGWSFEVAGTGYALGLILMMSLYTISSTGRTVGNTEHSRMEFWNNGVEPAQVSLLNQTINEISTRMQGAPNNLEVLALGNLPPSMQWEMRRQPIKTVQGIINTAEPAMIITSSDVQLSMNKAYRGRDFIVESTVDWDNFSTQDWLKWIMVRKSTLRTKINNILWVRTDLFPGYRSTLEIIE